MHSMKLLDFESNFTKLVANGLIDKRSVLVRVIDWYMYQFITWSNTDFLSIYKKRVLVFHKEEFWLLMPSQFRWMIYKHILFSFLNDDQKFNKFKSVNFKTNITLFDIFDWKRFAIPTSNSASTPSAFFWSTCLNKLSQNCGTMPTNTK